jgi:ribose transport system substrate-binding protein
VKQGILDATFQYPTGGSEAIDLALQLLRGKAVPRRVTLPTRIFTRDNVERGGDPIR